MLQFGLIGIGAGAAAALLFASVTSGTLFSIPLFYLASLPIMIAGLGWIHWSALIAALAASAALAAAFGGVFFISFLAGAGIPAWWLSYLTMLARPSAQTSGSGANGAAPAALEWYPPGRLVVWSAVMAALVVIVAIPYFGVDGDSFRNALKTELTRMLYGDKDAAGVSPEGAALIGLLVAAVPPAAAVLATVTNVVNLWLAARVVKFSGRLARPWPAIADMTFPPLVPLTLAVAIAISFLGGLIGILAGVVAASLLMAYGVLGFAVLHAVTRGIASRAFLLGGVYASVLVFGWPVLSLCLLGLAETMFGLRARAARKRGPPGGP
jgi:hypothetical protein